MIKVNLLEDIKSKKPEHYERSEKDHKDLVTTANKGIGAIRELKKHYGEHTIIGSSEFENELDQTDIGDVEELEFKIK